MNEAIYGLIGALVGGVVSYLLQVQQLKNEIKAIQEENKTEYVAESTAKHFLSHKGYTDRSFETLKKYLGGFEDDELRKILVRSGAVRIMKGNEEWWRLLSRWDEYIEKKKKQ